MIIEVLPPIWPSVLNLIEPAIYIEREVYACYKSIVWIYFVNKLLGFLSVNEQSTCTYKKATAPLPLSTNTLIKIIHTPCAVTGNFC